MIWLVVAAILAVVSLYVFWLRTILRAMPAFAPFYAWIEPVEALLWAKSRTVFLARLVWVPGALVTLHDFVLPYFGAVNWDPVSTKLLLALHIPTDFHAAAMTVFTMALAQAFDRLRHVTVDPLGAKE